MEAGATAPTAPAGRENATIWAESLLRYIGIPQELSCTETPICGYSCALESKLKKKRFLVVENDPNDAFLITRALKSSPAHGASTVCRHPNEAKDYLRGAGMYSNREVYPLPDVILSDLRLGNESGMELVAWIREQGPPLQDLPIIILTGSASALQFDAAETVGASRVCRKPSRLEDLQILLHAIADEYCK